MKDKVFVVFLLLVAFVFMGAASSTTTSTSKEVTASTSLGDPVIGKEIYESQGCGACHRINGLGGTIGPDLSHIYKKSYDYIRESIFEPNKIVVKGYKPVMPSYKKVLTESDIDNIVAYFRSLKKKK